MMALVVWRGTLLDIESTLSMALDSQSDNVGFDEVYNRTRREHREVNRRIRLHRFVHRL